MTKRVVIGIVVPFLIFVVGWFLYQGSVHQKLRKTDEIYQELEHPGWSKRIHRKKWSTPSGGSGDHRMLYLVDVRVIGIPLEEAVAYYERETDRLGFRECHVDGYSSGSAEFEAEVKRYRLGDTLKDDIVVILQAFTSSSTIRYHEPGEVLTPDR